MSTTNIGSTFYNIDSSKSFTVTLSTALVALSAHPCSEVLIINKSGQNVYIYDNLYFGDTNRLMISDNESIVLRGITNTSSVSAKTLSGGGPIYFRGQMYSNMNQR